jgi:hypothetical protein
MDKRIRSPNYPALSLPEAIERVAALYRAQHTHAAPREVVAKGLGYNSLNGASATAISALQKYGLLERSGDELKVSERGMRILHPHPPEDRGAAIREAAADPPLFAELREKFPGAIPSDDLLRNYLIRRGFAPGAVTAVISAYRETSEMAEREGRLDDSLGEQPPEHPDMPSQHVRQRETAASQQTTIMPRSGVPFEITYTPGGKIRIAGELTSRERADEFIKAIEALKLLMVTSEEVERPETTASDRHNDPDGPAAGTNAGILWLVTQEQKAALREQGYTDDQIRQMKPADAHRLLGLAN